ncbi:MAG TPA: cytochrome c [Balneolales bacterium]|nr:cytochrome c [Balneolales bacterium]
MKTLKIIIATLLAEIVLGIIFIYSGFYNVSVMTPDPGIMTWALSTTSDRSVEHHAANIKMPDLADSTMIAHGFKRYNEMCVGCHGAPGVKRGDGGKGLDPHPPDLARSAKEMPAKNLFWVIKNGIKSTGMPSFGKTHSDQKIQDIVAFLEQMKNMTPQQYAMMKKSTGAGTGDTD